MCSGLEEARLMAADNCHTHGGMAVISLSDNFILRETTEFKFFFDPLINDPNQLMSTDGLLILRLPKMVDGTSAIVRMLADCDDTVAQRHAHMITRVLWAFNAFHSIDDLGQYAANLKLDNSCARYAPVSVDFTGHMVFRAFEYSDGNMILKTMDILPDKDMSMYRVSFVPIFPYVYPEGEYNLMGEYLSLFPQRPQDRSAGAGAGAGRSAGEDKSTKKPSVFDALRAL